MEAKAGPLEVMTLPPSLRQDNPDNYSGQGKDQDGEDANSPSAASTASGEEKEMEEEEKDEKEEKESEEIKEMEEKETEEKEMEGSSDGSSFPGGFGSKAKSSPEVKPSLVPSPTQPVTVGELTSPSQWQLVQQPTTPPGGPLEPEPAEEARGEILYVRGPTHDPAHDPTSPPSPGEGSTSDSALSAGFKKYGESTSRVEAPTSAPGALTEALTTPAATAAELQTTRGARRTDPIAATTPPGNPPESATTEEASISISWVQEEREKTTRDLSAAPALSTSGAVWLTTVASGSNAAAAAAATEMESRSAVSESFVVGSRWTPFKSASPKSEDHEAPVSKDASNPFGSVEPNWAFGFIPSGT